MKAIFQRLFGDLQFSLRTALLFSVALSAVLAAVTWVEPTYKHHLLFTLGFGSLLLFRVGAWGVLTFFLGAAAGAWWGYTQEIGWQPTDPPFDDCLVTFGAQGVAVFLAIHGLFRKRFILAALGIYSAYQSRVWMKEGVYNENLWFT